MNAVTEINPTSEVQAFVNLRRQIHMMPKLGGETPATAALVAGKTGLLRLRSSPRHQRAWAGGCAA